MEQYSCIALCLFVCMSISGADSFDYERLIHDVGEYNKAIAKNDLSKQNQLFRLLLNKKEKAFECAIVLGFEPAVKKLISFPGIDINKATNDLMPIHIAARYGHKKILKLLLKSNININTPCEGGKYSPLHVATVYGKYEVAKYLIEKGANINMEGGDSMTPLDCSIYYNKFEIFKLLLDCAAVNSSRQASDGATPMHVAARFGQLDIVNALLEKGAAHDISHGCDDVTPLMVACQRGDLPIAKLFVKAKSRVNYMNDGGVSPLLLASQKGHLELVQYLLTLKDIEVDLADQERKITPLLAACVFGQVSIVSELLQAKADPFAKNWRGSGLLHIAAHQTSGNLLCFLLARIPQLSSDIVVQDCSGLTPLHFASMKGNLEAIKILLDEGASINASNNDYGKTPLFYVCQFGEKSAVKKLLERGADKTIRDKNGRLPIEIAQKNKHEDIVKLLENEIKQKSKKNKPKPPKKQKKKKGARPPLSLSHATKEEEKEEEESAYEDAPASKQNQVSISHASTHMVARRERGIKLDPASLFKFNVKKAVATHVVIEQEWNKERKLLVVYKRQETDPANLVVNMEAEYKQQDMFHGFDDTVDDYLCHGIKIDDNVSDLLCEYNVTLPIDGYAIVLPGKIAHQYYDYQYVDDDRERVERGQFDGAFVYLFDKYDRCFHRMFHQSKASRTINHIF